MSKVLTIQDQDSLRITQLMHSFHIKKQIDVVRAGLDLLEKEHLRIKQVERWKRATIAVAENSKEVNQEFQKYSRLKRNDTA